MTEVVNDRTAHPKDVPLEEEISLQKSLAQEYLTTRICEFRSNISKAVRNTYTGSRSIPNFVDYAATAIIDKENNFKQYNINMKVLFLNSIKTVETKLEILKERSEKNTSLVPEYKEHLKRLVTMIKQLVESKAITTNDCKIHLSTQLLADCDMVPSKVLFDRRLVRLNTAMLYKQDKYNLIREVGEGYASLMNELTSGTIDNEHDNKGKLIPTPFERIPKFLNIITAHIGVFHLDPNRVLDIILDFFIRQLTVNYKFWIQLMKESEWIRKLKYTDALTGETTCNSSAIMGQLFGFRFHNYQNQHIVPSREFYLALAILLKNSLVNLADVLPYLYPYGEDIEEKKKEYNTKINKEISTNSGGKLAMYGALGEEGATQKIKRSAEEDAEEVEDVQNKEYAANDVVELVRALFSIGDLKNAHLMLTEYDKLIDLYPELAYDIYRLCRTILQPAYELFVTEKNRKLYAHFADCAERSQIKAALATQDDLNPALPSQIKLKRVLVTDALLHDTSNLEEKERYTFFYKEWQEQLHFCREVEDLTRHFLPLMRLAGYRTYLATDLIQKLILIIEGIITRSSEFTNSRVHCINMLREILLPAISFSNGNLGTMASVWEVLCRFSFQERYALYGEWYFDFYKKNVETKLLKARTERSVKAVMRRINKDDVRRFGRDLGKLAHSNPTIVFNTILDQIQQFDNMAPMMADACRYLGDFAYDVLGFVLTDKWTGATLPGRMVKEKEKDDGMPATWLRSLAVFSGMLFKKQDIDTTPLLRYIARRLRSDNSVADLVLLNEFVTKMAGIEILASACTDDQITAAGCSDSLKAEAFLPIAPENRRASRRVLDRLQDSLRRSNVGFDILVLLYNLEEVVSSEYGLPAADRCSKLDRVRQSQLQYFELLTSLFEKENFDALMPSVADLVNNYRLPLHVALTFNRPKTSQAIRKNNTEPIEDGVIWKPFQPLSEAITSLLSNPPLNSIFSSEFFVIFWQLSLYDIYCPENHYETAIKRQTEIIRQCQDTRSSFYQNNRMSVVSKTERQAQANLKTLREDLPAHKAHVEKVMKVLMDSKSRWFPNINQRQQQISSIMEHCILPRSQQSEVDAAFCFEFIMLMHRINVPNFSSLTLFDKMFSDHLPVCFLAFSEYETTIYSRFIFKALQKMQQWHADEKLYVKEAHGEDLIGFQKNWNSTPAAVAKEDLLSYNDFRRVLYKWHYKTSLTIEQALKSGEAHIIKNAFLVLRQFAPCFPATSINGDSIYKIVKRLSEEEKRGNIKVLARSYLGLIAKYKPKWVSKETFVGIKEVRPVEIKITPKQESSTSSEKVEKASSAEDDKHHESNGSTSQNKHLSTTSSPSSSRREASPKRSKERSSSRTEHQQTASTSASERKRSREGDSSNARESESSKYQRTEDNNSSRHHHRTPTSSSRRDSPRESRDSTAQVQTPSRSNGTETSSSSSHRDSSIKDTGRELTTSRKDPSASTPRGRGSNSSSNLAVNGTSASISNGGSANSSSSRANDDEKASSRTPRSHFEVSASSSSRHEERSSRAATSSSASSTPRTPNESRGVKRSLDSNDRDRDRDRTDKRREVDRSRTERVRSDDRRDDRARRDDRSRRDDRRIDDRRLDDRRLDDRRDRDRHDRRGRR